MDNVNDKDLSDEPPRPPDFVPHVTRIAHLMDHKVSKKQNKKIISGNWNRRNLWTAELSCSYYFYECVYPIFSKDNYLNIGT